MRRLSGELVGELTLPAPAPPQELYRALCDAMGRRRGRPVLFRTAVFPPGTASGLWLDLADSDLVVVEERTAPDHQLVILGHELWHMHAGHHGHDVEGVGVAARLLAEGTGGEQAAVQAAVLRVAARTRCVRAEERDAETFGLLLASKCRTWLAGSALRGPVRRHDVAGRIEASLGYPGK
ncbi:toxin-antitoxin system, toxin component [Streptomyces sp. Ag109_O5-1]|uniref:toxin-antitoxin system, toxin component n=1 Tax=Streptomyces sp. Ag109_O5-1 TaxID=1938851 RepID=UPI000F51343E|nr:toxin-antitoxin system, toxin component [Streptomyces sp. Ag109_O5-1]